jgi:NAD(P)-dependent dehydrogenase (short-subunit alcohol dehydrogenase family)
MTGTAHDLAPEQGKFGRVPAAVSAFVQSLASFSLDYTFDRVVGLAFAALCAFLQVLERAKTGIAVNAVAPGPIETELLRRNAPAGSEAERIFLTNIPTRRLGQPEEVAAAAAFPFWEDASFITGQTLSVDGGGSIGKAAI